MSLLDTINSLATDTVTVVRQATETFVNGISTPGAVISTFSIKVVVEPATGMQKVVAGRDMQGTESEGQFVNDVRIIYTATELKNRTPANIADVITFESGSWTVFRVEKWNLSGVVHYRAVLTRSTLGAS